MIDRKQTSIDIPFSFSQVPQFNSDESRLRSSLLQNYVPQARPVLNPTTVTLVDVGLSIIQVMSLVRRDLSSRWNSSECNRFRTNKIK